MEKTYSHKILKPMLSRVEKGLLKASAFTESLLHFAAPLTRAGSLHMGMVFHRRSYGRSDCVSPSHEGLYTLLANVGHDRRRVSATKWWWNASP